MSMKNMSPLVAMGFIMSGVLVLLALMCLLVPTTQEWLQGWRRYAMAALLIAYASFRYTRARKLWLQSKRENLK
ncbi:MAG: hypothetical protein ACKVOR_07375 [Flavobacteriales bacterium]